MDERGVQTIHHIPSGPETALNDLFPGLPTSVADEYGQTPCVACQELWQETQSRAGLLTDPAPSSYRLERSTGWIRFPTRMFFGMSIPTSR